MKSAFSFPCLASLAASISNPVGSAYCVLVAQLCPTLCDSMDCSPPGSSVHGILQTRILEWVAIFFSRGSSWPRDRTWESSIAVRFFTVWVTREAHPYLYYLFNPPSDSLKKTLLFFPLAIWEKWGIKSLSNFLQSTQQCCLLATLQNLETGNNTRA